MNNYKLKVARNFTDKQAKILVAKISQHNTETYVGM